MAVPTISAVSPSGGPAGGGSIVTLTGTGFTGTTGVTFGGLSSPGFTIVSDTSLEVYAPAHVDGAAAIVVTNATGPSTSVASFQYGVAPTAPTFAASVSNLAFDPTASQSTGALSTGLGYASDVSTSATLADQRIGGESFDINYHAPTP